MLVILVSYKTKWQFGPFYPKIDEKSPRVPKHGS